MRAALFSKEGRVVGWVDVPIVDGKPPRVVVKDSKCYVADAEFYEQYRETTWLNEPAFSQRAD